VVAGVDVAGEALQPVGNELDRPAQDFGNDGNRDLVGVDMHLDAVAAADVAADDAHVALGQPHVLGEHALHHVRGLRRVMHGEPGASAVVVGQDRARLDGEARVAAAVKGGLDDFVRIREGVVDLAGLVDALEAEVVAELGVDHGRGGQERGFHVHHGGERLVVDTHVRNRIFCRCAAFCHHRGDRLADPSRPLQRQG
jgi:hypothetical protein